LLLALRSANFRWYTLGLLTFATAQEMQRFMLPWLAYDQTGSKAVLGLASFSVGIGTLVFTPLGGLAADRLGRIQTIRITQSFLALLAGLLALGLLVGVIGVAHLLVFGVLTGVLAAFDQPSRQALVPRLVPREALLNATALTSSIWSLARISGPGVGGILLAVFVATGHGPLGVFLVVMAGFAIMVVCASRIHISVPKAGQRASVLSDLKEGIHFIVSRPAVRTLLLIVFANSLFGTSFVVLMPAFAREVYHVDAGGLGALVASIGLGALVGTALLAVFGGARKRGPMLLATSIAYGLLLIAFANSREYSLAIPLLLLAGAMGAWYTAADGTLLQLMIPDALLGRVMGVYSLGFSLGPLGGALSGAMAELWGPPVATMVGGCLVVLVSVSILVMAPHVRSLE
jgi:MFS family permease